MRRALRKGLAVPLVGIAIVLAACGCGGGGGADMEDAAFGLLSIHEEIEPDDPRVQQLAGHMESLQEKCEKTDDNVDETYVSNMVEGSMDDLVRAGRVDPGRDGVDYVATARELDSIIPEEPQPTCSLFLSVLFGP